jgi:hypothetical protein
MNNKYKQILAKEVIIFLKIIIIGLLIFYILRGLRISSDPVIPLYSFLCKIWNIVLFIGFGGGYIVYLLIRFIIWAIKTLKER